MDSRVPRDGKAIEEVGTYDPMIRERDRRVTMKGDRIDYWIGVGATPTERVARLIEKYKGKVPEVRIDERKMPGAPPPAVARPRPKPPAPPAAETPATEGAETPAATGETEPATVPPTEQAPATE